LSRVLEIRGLNKSYGALKVIDDLSLHLDEGEALGVVGPNGAGKTTMFDLILGTTEPDSGEIEFERMAIVSDQPYRRARAGLGRTFQVPQPFGGLSVFENLLVGAAFGDARRDDDEARCVALLESTGLIDKANRLAETLTLLERKRLELARALATKPRVLLLDEIAGGLTEPEVEELVVLIRQIHAGGTSIIWIEHLLHALLKVVDRVVALHFGRHLIEGDPAEVMKSQAIREVYLGIDE
jgi:branched-chain amino acid transport system ATP-binding protein